MKLVVLSCLFLLVPKCSSTNLFHGLLSDILRPKLFNTILSAVNGTECAANLTAVIDGLYKYDWRSIQMLDAFGKVHPGVLRGNRRMLGSYDQCISLQNFQYCLIAGKPNEKLRKFFYDNSVFGSPYQGSFKKNIFSMFAVVHYGACIPKSCSTSEVNKMLNNLKKSYHILDSVEVSTEICYHKDEEIALSTTDICTFFLFLLVIAMEFTSTIYDLYSRRRGHQPNIFVSLSWYTNSQKLLSTHCENDSLTCLYGIKVLSVIWIMVAHFLVGKAVHAINSADVMLEWIHQYRNAVVIAAPYAVDTFLAISGSLVVYVYLRYSDKFTIHWSWFYLHRILRLGPVLLGTVLINITFLKYFVDGPFAFRALAVLQKKCENGFWPTLLFASNFVSEHKRCLPHSWYLAVDTQLYFLAPILLYFIKQYKAKAFLGVCVVCGISFFFSWMYVLRNNSGFVYFFEEVDDVYTNVIFRMPVWLIGTYFGYLLYEHKFNKRQIPKTLNTIIWIVCLCTMTICVLYQVFVLREEYNAYRSAFLNTFSRPLWALAVCYIIFSCATGNAELVNKFLSHSLFIVLGKLTYSTYFIHVTVSYIVVTKRRQVGHFSNFEYFLDACGQLPFIFAGALVLCLVLEAPVVSLVRHLEARDHHKKLQ